MPENSATRVMLVEDANLVRFYYRGLLEPAGYDIDQALNGVEALERLLVQPAHLLIVDINMPLMDGLTFIRALRRHSGAIASIPVLVTSTECGAQDVSAARQAGANFYLPKPVDRATLMEHVELMTGGPRWTA